MILSLSGSDSYRRLKRLKELIFAYKKKYPAAIIQKFDFENSNRETDSSASLEFREFARNQSLFGPKKLAILESVWQERKKIGQKEKNGKGKISKNLNTITRDSAAEFKKILKNFGSLTDLTVFISDASGPKSGFDFLFEKPNVFEKFDELEEREFKLFIQEEIKERGINLSEAVVDFLVYHFRGDSWAAVTEVEKLRWFKAGEEKNAIGIEAIKSLGNYAESPDIFSFINILGYRGGLEERVTSFEKLLFLKEEPAKIFNFLSSRTYDLSLLRRLADYDMLTKAGKIGYEEILLDLCLT
ncbi:hypothetical protein HYV91_01245 [Candidatus Wolfebacteria bacterium]|nr:hypothetical protein [Candidatus Wolfebacteria bacterium]